MRRLVADADVFLTNLRPEAVERLGLGPDALHGRQPAARLRQRHRLRARRARRAPGRLRRRRLLGPHRRRRHARRRPARRRRRSAAGSATTSPASRRVAGILAALLEREQTGRGPARRDLAAAHRHLLPRLGPRHPGAVRQARSTPCPATSEINPMVNSYRGRRRPVVLAARRRGRPGLAQAVRGDRPARPARRRALQLGARPAQERVDDDRDARRGVRRRTRAPSCIERFDRARRVVGAGQHAGRRARRPAGDRRRRVRRRAGGGGRAGAPGRGLAGHVPRRRRRPPRPPPIGRCPGSASTPTAVLADLGFTRGRRSRRASRRVG